MYILTKNYFAKNINIIQFKFHKLITFARNLQKQLANCIKYYINQVQILQTAKNITKNKMKYCT